jgi:hypothetical protein
VSKRFAQVIVLLEDKQQRSFIGRLLQKLGYPIHKLNFLPTPAGKGSGADYVLEQYPLQVKALRPRAQYQSVALVVVIDGDNLTVAERNQQLTDRLVSSGLAPRQMQSTKRWNTRSLAAVNASASALSKRWHGCVNRSRHRRRIARRRSRWR